MQPSRTAGGEWPVEWEKESIMAKELVPIVLSCVVWGRSMARKVVLFQCVQGRSREPLVMHLLRSLCFFAAYYDISIKIEHIAGIHNGTADHNYSCNVSVSLY